MRLPTPRCKRWIGSLSTWKMLFTFRILRVWRWLLSYKTCTISLDRNLQLPFPVRKDHTASSTPPQERSALTNTIKSQSRIGIKQPKFILSEIYSLLTQPVSLNIQFNSIYFSYHLSDFLIKHIYIQNTSVVRIHLKYQYTYIEFWTLLLFIFSFPCNCLLFRKYWIIFSTNSKTSRKLYTFAFEEKTIMSSLELWLIFGKSFQGILWEQSRQA